MPALDGRVPVMFHAPDAIDVENALEFSDEYHLRPVLLHASDASRLGDTVRSHKSIVILSPLKLDDPNRVLKNGGKLTASGTRVAFCTDAPSTDPGSLRMSALLAVKYGMSPEAAIRSITLSGAEALGIQSKIGSIEPGKDADLLLLTGEPLDLTSRVTTVISGGKVAYEAGK